MRYQSKPSDKIFTTESTGSIKTNFPLSHIDGHIVGRLFFAPSPGLTSFVLCLSSKTPTIIRTIT